jgi:hypothetical protein
MGMGGGVGLGYGVLEVSEKHLVPLLSLSPHLRDVRERERERERASGRAGPSNYTGANGGPQGRWTSEWGNADKSGDSLVREGESGEKVGTTKVEECLFCYNAEVGKGLEGLAAMPAHLEWLCNRCYAALSRAILVPAEAIKVCVCVCVRACVRVRVCAYLHVQLAACE